MKLLKWWLISWKLLKWVWRRMFDTSKAILERNSRNKFSIHSWWILERLINFRLFTYDNKMMLSEGEIDFCMKLLEQCSLMQIYLNIFGQKQFPQLVLLKIILSSIKDLISLLMKSSTKGNLMYIFFCIFGCRWFITNLEDNLSKFQMNAD